MTILLRAGAVIVAIVMSVGSAVAQQPTRLPGTYITGQVVAANGDTPLRRVRIDVRRGSWTGDPVLTDNEGRFFIDLERAGPLSVTATKGGYLIASTAVNEADLSKPVLIRLLRGAVITGTAINENGLPVVAAGVLAKRLDPAVEGFLATVSAETDDRGEYRLAGLAPGRYELSAGLTVVPGLALVISPTDQKALADATKVTVVVEPGDQIGGVQLTVPESRTAAAQLRAAELKFATARPPAVRGPGGLRGRVLSDARKPIPDTRVVLSGPGLIHTMRTDGFGTFSVVGLRPGRYILQANRGTGISDNWGYGQESGGSIGTPIVVTDHIEEGIDIILPRHVALQGVVVDENGEPVQGARVQALQVDYSSGRVLAVPAGSERRTDDQGGFRLWGLLPGTYLVSASLDGLFRDRRGERVAYAPVYYPGTPLVAAASAIELRDDTAVSLVFAPAALSQITGKAGDADGPLVGGTVRLVESRRPGVISTTPRSTPVNGDGTFIIRNVPPGDYVLHVRGDGPGRTGLFATQAVSVGSDPVNVQIRTSHGMGIEGRTVVEGKPEFATCTPEPALIAAGVVSMACDSSRSGFSVGPVALDDFARAEATMVFGWSTNEFFGMGLFGRLAFALRNAPDENWYLKSFTINGTDIADSGFDFGSQPGTITDAEIVLSHNGASIAGQRADKGPNTGYYVLAFPASRDGLPSSSRRVKFTRSANDGSFRIAGLPAGDYLVAATSRLRANEWQSPELMQQLAARAERVTLSEGQQATLSVRVIER